MRRNSHVSGHTRVGRGDVGEDDHEADQDGLGGCEAEGLNQDRVGGGYHVDLI